MIDFKLMLYLETTTFNWFFDERPGHEDVVRLFEAIRAGQFVGYTSTYVTDELEEAEEPKRSNMFSLIDDYGIIVLDRHNEARVLAASYIDGGLLPKSQLYDSLHIATASLYGLDAIVSYNFSHINRRKCKVFIPEINKAHGIGTEHSGAIMFLTAKEVFNHVQLLRG